MSMRGSVRGLHPSLVPLLRVKRGGWETKRRPRRVTRLGQPSVTQLVRSTTVLVSSRKGDPISYPIPSRLSLRPRLYLTRLFVLVYI